MLITIPTRLTASAPMNAPQKPETLKPGTNASLQAAQILGADAILPKPISRDRLMQTIQSLTEGPALPSH